MAGLLVRVVLFPNCMRMLASTAREVGSCHHQVQRIDGKGLQRSEPVNGCAGLSVVLVMLSASQALPVAGLLVRVALSRVAGTRCQHGPR